MDEIQSDELMPQCYDEMCDYYVVGDDGVGDDTDLYEDLEECPF